MNRILAALAGGLLAGAFAVSYAELPPPTPEEKAAAAAKKEKDAAAKAKAAKEVAAAQDRAVANYKKNQQMKNRSSSAGASAQPQPEQGAPAAQVPAGSQGANHADGRAPDSELTRQEAQTEMPKAGQVNDYSTPNRDPQNSSAR